MSEPILEIKTDFVSLDGLEDVFDVEPVTGTGAEPIPGTPEPVTGASGPVTDAPGVPVEQAALALGTSVNALKKRLRKGSLLGTKVESKHGEKWFVAYSELANLAPVPGTGAPDFAGIPEPVTRAAEPVTDTLTAMPTGAKGVPYQQVTEIMPALERLVTSLEKKDAVIESQAHQLKAAGDVIMYLRSQIEDKESQLKLLTDSQHKTGWWSRFCSWFKV
ncbi:MAG: hypothetical protein HYX67_11055 [Candidatus Melainabacteria bacterium]|nr:hypothetical protein [Candidatus Melainabacteria bacterium]